MTERDPQDPAIPPTHSGSLAAAIALGVAATAGGLLQLAVPPDRTVTAVFGVSVAVIHGVVVDVLPARLRRAFTDQEAFATMLGAIAAVGILGTLVLQGQPASFYRSAWGVVGGAIVALRVDDLFHSRWFAGMAGVFGGSVILSAAQRWPPTLRNLGYHLSHLGLLVAVCGGAASSALAVRGRIDLRAGEAAGAVEVRGPDGSARVLPLGFELRLDRFEVERYGTPPVPEEVRAFRSTVSALGPSGVQGAALEVNSPLRHGGWTFYQVGYDPRDPRYSGIEAVRDPGAAWVFVGFALVAGGVIQLLYVESRRRARASSRAAVVA
ncbi:MAG: cytochrome c biogenesis protein ResB [Anaeromyxobacteraceae bacterium]